MSYAIKILHLFPDLLNLYGDKGNLAALEKRLTWRGINATTQNVTMQDSNFDLADTDIVFLGGGSDREQEVVVKLLSNKKDMLKQYVEDGGVLLATCGGFEMLGEFYYSSGAKAEGLGILSIHAEPAEKRFISDVIVKTELTEQSICGFENHAGCIDIGDYAPLGKVVYGGGNDKKSGNEGLVYKNLIATYLHGPLLPKNPQLCDAILCRALKKKYPDFKGLSSLDDTLEHQANDYILRLFSTTEKKN